jgi:serine/threonine protein kinase
MDPPLWTEGASPWPHEREALGFIRPRLPNHEPYRAWNNVEFIAEDGSVNEVDLLVVTGRGFFLVEIKSWPGVLLGDGQRWRLRRPNGTEKPIDHPLILTNTKAKRLRSLLARQSAFRNDRPPWVSPLVFLSSPELQCRLDDIARSSVCGRDPDLPRRRTGEPKTAVGPLPGVVAALKDPTTVGLRANAINKPLSAKIAQALDQAGLKPSNRGRKVGDWELGELLDEGPGWQDFVASRPRINTTRRVRIYLAGLATTTEEEERLRRQADREFRVVQDIRHDGVAQPLDLVQAERGPALLFDQVDGEERLDLWAPTALEHMNLDARIELVRQLGEAIAHAHARKVSHRALTARSVLVQPTSADRTALPRLVIGHWQSGARELASRLTSHVGTQSGTLGSALTDRLDASEQVYLAPEAFSVEDPDGAALDVFSLGALAFLLLSGQPPAADLTEREETLAAHHGLALDAAVDNLPDDLITLVAMATDPVPAQRATVRELLDLLDDALDTLTAPTPSDDGTPSRSSTISGRVPNSPSVARVRAVTGLKAAFPISLSQI